MKISVLLFLTVIIFLGCSSTYIVNESDDQNIIPKINKLGKTYYSHVTLNDGQEFSTTTLSIRNDTLYTHKNESQVIPLRMVSSIKLKDTVRGFLDGAFMGIPVAILGGIIAPKNSGGGDLRGLGTLLYAVGAFSATVLINAVLSGNKTFEFKRNKDNSFSEIN